MVTDRLVTIPIAASIMTSLGSRLMAAEISGPSAVINSQLANRGIQNQKISRWRMEAFVRKSRKPYSPGELALPKLGFWRIDSKILDVSIAQLALNLLPVLTGANHAEKSHFDHRRVR